MVELVNKACKWAMEIAETGKFGTLSDLSLFCYENGIFMQEDDDRIWIEDEYFMFKN